MFSIGFSFATVSYIFTNIINSEMKRGGEEYAERAITRIQKWATAIFVMSLGSVAGIIIFRVLVLLGLIQIGN